MPILPPGSEFLLLICAISSVVTWWSVNISRSSEFAKFFAWFGVSAMISLLIWILGSN